MGISVESKNRRINSRRVGSVDWQDAMDSFAQYADLVEDEGVRELLMDMREAELLINDAEAPQLARIFARENPKSLAVAVIKPLKPNGAKFLEIFIETLTERGYAAAHVPDEAAAEAFFREVRAQRRGSGALGAVKRLFGRGRKKGN